MAARTFRKKKQQQSRVFFNFIFDVYTHVDNSVVVVQNNVKERQKACCTCNFFLLIRSIDVDAIFIAVPV